MKATSKFLSGLFAVAVIGLIGVPPAQADLFTATGTGGDGPVSASANFAVSNGQIVITLTNLLTPAQITSAGQALSDVRFTLSNAPGTVNSASATGTVGNIDTNGHVVSTTPNVSIPRWVGAGPPPPNGTGTFTITGNTLFLSTIGGGQPDHMILPTGTDFNFKQTQFNPYVLGPLTITLALSGVTTSTKVSNVFLSFGTGPDTEIPATPTIPEPSTLALAAVGALGFAGYSMRRRHAR